MCRTTAVELFIIGGTRRPRNPRDVGRAENAELFRSNVSAVSLTLLA